MNDPVPSEPRFAFGRNWSRFLRRIDEATIRQAEESLRAALGQGFLRGRTFLDLGSGSGLFSLAAWRLGAAVRSIDIDPESVACTRELKKRFADQDDRWQIQTGSILDREFLQRQEPADIVYSWGVLHHTGEMWSALANAIDRVAANGQLYIAIYNDQGAASRRWWRIKRLYNRVSGPLQPAILLPALLRIWGPTVLRDALRGRPFYSWRTYHSARGMNAWYDLVDWVGGYPFEVARPEAVIDFCLHRHLRLTHLKTCGGGRGCNEYVFVRMTNGS